MFSIQEYTSKKSIYFVASGYSRFSASGGSLFHLFVATATTTSITTTTAITTTTITTTAFRIINYTLVIAYFDFSFLAQMFLLGSCTVWQ